MLGLTRLRNGVVPYQQIIADANPDAPTHWLRERMDKGLAHELVSTHQDNPILYNHDTDDWTAEGRRYVIETLGRLTGVRLERLRYGRWVAAEGVVYEGFDRAKNFLTEDEAAEMSFKHFVVGIDWGYTNPGVMSLWGIDADDRMVRVKEIYHTGKLMDWWIGYALDMQGEYNITAFVCDPSYPAYIKQMTDAGIPAVAAKNDIPLGIQAVSKRLKVQEDGLPRLMLVRDGLMMRDEGLVMSKRPFCTEMEFDVYVWPKNRSGRIVGENPVSANDHGMDAMRYVAMYVDDLLGLEDDEDEVWAA